MLPVPVWLEGLRKFFAAYDELIANDILTFENDGFDEETWAKNASVKLQCPPPLGYGEGSERDPSLPSACPMAAPGPSPMDLPSALALPLTDNCLEWGYVIDLDNEVFFIRSYLGGGLWRVGLRQLPLDED